MPPDFQSTAAPPACRGARARVAAGRFGYLATIWRSGLEISTWNGLEISKYWRSPSGDLRAAPRAEDSSAIGAHRVDLPAGGRGAVLGEVVVPRDGRGGAPHRLAVGRRVTQTPVSIFH